MKIETFNFEYISNYGKSQNTATVTEKYNKEFESILEIEIKFEKRVNKLTFQQFFDLMSKIEKAVQKINSDSELTISDVSENPDNLPATNSDVLKEFGMAFKKDGLKGSKNFLEKMVNSLGKSGKLTEEEKNDAKSAFSLIDKFLGKND